MYQQFCLWGHVDDLKNLLRYLKLQYNVVSRRHSLLAPVEAHIDIWDLLEKVQSLRHKLLSKRFLVLAHFMSIYN